MPVPLLLGASLLLAVLLALLGARRARAALLPASDYVARQVCQAPAPGSAGCLAVRLTARTAAEQARIAAAAGQAEVSSAQAPSECAALYQSSCLGPQEIQQAYFPGEAPDAPASEPQTIALVDAYNDLNAEADLNTYSKAFELKECTKANGCFTKVGETGSETVLPFPVSESQLEAYASGHGRRWESAEEAEAKAEEAEGWALETDTDIEIAHAVCQNCRIVLVEAASSNYHELETAESTAVALHATEISNSWGGEEEEGGRDSSAFNHPGIVIAAAAGDDGYLNWAQYPAPNQTNPAYFEGADYPASSPHVLSVGGTELSRDARGDWAGETPWNAVATNEGAGGSGCSSALQAPAWQSAVSDWAQVGCGSHRANADVSADADPSTGVNVYDSTPYPGEGGTFVPYWGPIGGTSVASPMISAMFALAGGAHGVAYPAATLYAHLGGPALHDVSTGGNGACDNDYSGCEDALVSPLDCGEGAWICNATVGYDGPTGVGTPDGLAAFKPTSGSGGEGETQTTTPEEAAPAGGSPGGGSGPAQPLNGGSSGSGSGAATGSGGGTSLGSTAVARILALRLTASAQAATRLHARRGGAVRLDEIAFSLRMTKAGLVRVRLSVERGRPARWRKPPFSFAYAFTAAKGVGHRHLRGSARLAPGVYRLTLTPTGGVARSLVFRVL